MKEKLTSMILMMIPLLGFSQDFEVIFDDGEILAKSDTTRPKIALAKHSESGKKGKTLDLSMNDSMLIDTLRMQIIEKARQYIGVNYKYGQSNENGFDCSGYVKYIYGQFGYTLPHSSYEQYSKSKPLKGNNAKPGDLVFFVTRGSKVSHVGIYMGDNTFIHSPSRGKQVRIDSLDSEYFRRHLAGFRTIIY
jgi:cell wall-associated NlpC family hydrolase